MVNEWPRGCVDHINLNKADNRWVNLRVCSMSQNKGNIRAHKSSKTGVKGVWLKKPGRWEASIMVKSKRHHLGTFNSVQEAKAAYAKAADHHFCEFARH